MRLTMLYDRIMPMYPIYCFSGNGGRIKFVSHFCFFV